MTKIQYLTEGGADKALLEILEIPSKQIDRQGSNSSLANAMKAQKDNFHKIIVGLTDKDKKNLPPYYSEFETLETPDNII